MLEESAIDPMVIAERGYWSATTKAELERLGFGKSQQLAPALVVPIYGVDGELATYQIRPDTPRLNQQGKPRKYEMKIGDRPVLDVPRSIRDRLGDPNTPLWITEGSKKVDSALSHGLTCVGLLGVWNWRGTNDAGGKTVLADLEYVALNDRKVYVAYDSDAMQKREVFDALERFTGLLTRRGADVRYVYIPTGDGRKLGLDDFLAAGGTVEDLVRTASNQLPPLPSDEPETESEWAPDERALEEAKRLLDAPDLVARVGEVVGRLGYAGETIVPKVVYLAITSRLLERPINLLLVGPSSAGKSYTVDLTSRLFPERAIYRLTASSERALIYTKADLSRRTLILGEMPTLRDTRSVTALVLKAIAGEGRVSYETVESTTQGMRAVRIEKPGPTAFVTTTTGRVDSELQTRLLAVPISDTADVTRKILAADAARRNGHAPEVPDLEPWHALQWWLANEGDHEVTIPYGERLAELVPAGMVRMRRDWTQLANLISASAILHQRQRRRDERGRIIATRADYELVFELVADLFGQIQAEGVTPETRETVLAVKMQTGDKPTCSIQQVAGHLKLARSTADSRVRTALRGGWIVNAEDSRGRPAKLQVGEPLPEDRPALPTPDELFADMDILLTSSSDSSRRHVADSADIDGEMRGDDSVTDNERGEQNVTTNRQRDEQSPVTASGDSDAKKGERDDVTTSKSGSGARLSIELNYGRARACDACGGRDFWAPAGDWARAQCLACEPPPASAAIRRQWGAAA